MHSPVDYIVALDAMGVIYKVGDDVGELLVPFIIEENGCDNSQYIEQQYLLASTGEITASEFWNRMDLSSDLEDKYLEKLELNSGLYDFLQSMKDRGARMACLSNDVAEWSLKLRKKFALDEFIEYWVISGNVNCRKPDKRIYQIMINKLDAEPGTIFFVDDRVPNLNAAKSCGLIPIHFVQQDLNTPKHDGTAGKTKALGFEDLRKIVEDYAH